jgi:Zn ribbon nucleic-acid-binding protein
MIDTTCPKCKHFNAMLAHDDKEGMLSCRDCGHECTLDEARIDKDLVVEVRSDEAPGFSEVVMHDYEDQNGSFYVIEVSPPTVEVGEPTVKMEEFYDAYGMVTDHLDAHESCLYYKVEAA